MKIKKSKYQTTQGELYYIEGEENGYSGEIHTMTKAPGLARIGGGNFWVFIHLKERAELDISEKLVSIHTSLYLAKKGLEKAIALGNKVTFIKYPSF